MAALEALPFILFIVVIGTAVAERINIPYPLLLVVAGLIIGFVPGIPHWQLPGRVVLALFLPPILFSAARNISWRDTKQNLDSVFSLSILLVVATTLVLAWLLNLVFPNFGIEAALVLGAIVSPTDAIAATSILNRMNVKQSLIRTIEVESLFNDATGISLYTMAGMFAIYNNNIDYAGVGEFMLLNGIGGIAIGILFSYFTNLIIEEFLTRSENNLPIVMGVILAYVAYLFAERLGMSGILAVVAAGLFHKRIERHIRPQTRLSEKTVWSMLVFFLNGLIFITIGNQFPTYLKKVEYIPFSDLIYLSVFTIAVIILLRLLWVTISAYCDDQFAKWRGQYEVEERSFSLKRITIVSWSGMRGMVSLALAAALPPMLNQTQPFPHLNLILFLTMMVILFTLLVQGLTLPFVVKWVKGGKDDHAEMAQIEKIYQSLTKEAIENMRQFPQDKHKPYTAEAMKLVGNYYANRLLHFTMKVESSRTAKDIVHEAQQLLSHVLDNDRRSLIKLRIQGEISEEVYIKILRKLDRDEVGFSSYP